MFSLLISLARSVFQNKYAVFGILIAIAGALLLFENSRVNMLKEQVAAQERQIADLNLQLKAKEAQIDLNQEALKADDQRLQDCYLQLQDTIKSQKEIDDIMNEKEAPKTAEPTPEPEAYTPVTVHQMQRGLVFVNNQIDRL